MKDHMSAHSPDRRLASLWHTAVLEPIHPRYPEAATQILAEIDAQRTSTKGLTKQLLEAESRSVAWILEGLYQGEFSHPRAAFILPLSSRFYSNSRKDPVPFPLSVIKRVLRALESLEWVKVHLGFHEPEGSGQITAIEASGGLSQLFDYGYLEWAPLVAPPASSLLEIADASSQKVRHLLSDEAGDKVALWRNNLDFINKNLLAHCIFLNAPNDVILEAGAVSSEHLGKQDQRVQPSLNFSRVTLRRIFARQRVDQGGRFYGGWWQNIGSKYRKHISIDHDMACEADYSGMALNCLYALEGKSLGQEDPYDIGLGISSYEDPRRKIVKKYINAVLNDESGKYRLPPEELKILGVKHTELRDLATRRHAEVAHHFHTGVGLHLQFVESEIAEKVLLHFTSQDEVCLPVHDSFIVREQLIDELVLVMNEEFQRRFGQKIQVRPDEVFTGERIEIPDPSNIPRGLAPTEQADVLHTIHWGRVSIANRYFTSWVMKTTSLEVIEANYRQAVQAWQHLRPFIREKTKDVVFP